MKQGILNKNQKYVLTTFMLVALFSTYSFNFHATSVSQGEYASTASVTESVNLGGKNYKFEATEWQTTVKEGETEKVKTKVQVKFTEGSYCDTCAKEVTMDDKSLSNLADIKVALLEGYTKFLAEAKPEAQKEEVASTYPKIIQDKINSCSSKEKSAAVTCYVSAFVDLSKKLKLKDKKGGAVQADLSEEKLKEFYHEYISAAIKSSLDDASDKEDYSNTLDAARDLTSDSKVSGSFKDEIKKDIKEIVKATYKDFIKKQREEVLEFAKSYQQDYNSGVRQYTETAQMCRSGMIDQWDCQDRLETIGELNDELFEKRNTLVENFNSTFSTVRNTASPAEYFHAGSQNIYQNEFYNPMMKAQINLRLDPAGMYLPLSQAQLLTPQDTLNNTSRLMDPSNTSMFSSSRVRMGQAGERFMFGQQGNQFSPIRNQLNQNNFVDNRMNRGLLTGLDQNIIGQENIRNNNWGVHNSLVRPTSLSPQIRNNGLPSLWQGF